MWMARLTAFTIFWLQPSNVHLEKKVTSDDLPLIGYISVITVIIKKS